LKEFKVKVTRYDEELNGSIIWDGFYVSDVYAIDGVEFLVYDPEKGFKWVNFYETMLDPNMTGERMPTVILYEE